MFESSSESSSGVYKSKLFNFLNRRSQQFINQSKIALRHVQVAANWGVQIALYPVYLLIQTSRNLAWQLQESAAKREAISLNNEVDNQQFLSPKVDKPIVQTLELVKEFLPELFSQTPVLGTSQFDNNSNNSNSIYPYYQPSFLIDQVDQVDQDSTLTLSNNIYPHPLQQAQGNAQHLSLGGLREQENLAPILSGEENGLMKVGLFIQGIANLITSRNLVLVDNNNQILDILTPEQQKKLAEKITWEVASYGYDRHRFLQSQKRISKELPSPQSPQTLLPAKWFWRVMAWVQRGEVAIAANLFQESNLAIIDSSTNSSTNLLKIFSEINFSSFPILPISTTTLQIVDQQVYEIEIKQITPASQWLNQIGERLLPLMVSPQQVLSRTQSWGISQGISNSQAGHLENNSEDNLENPRENIWALIQGAIAYFFGKRYPQEISSIPGHPIDYSLNSSIPSILYPSLNSSPKYQELPFSEDDWLTSEDLFKTFLHQEIHDYEDEDMIDISSVEETKLLSQTNHPSFAQVMAHQKKTNKPPANNPLAKRNIGENTKKSPTNNSHGIQKKSTYPKPSKSDKSAKSANQRINSRDVKDRIITSRYRSPDLADNNHNWIETEVTSRGYVKHPLQKCLEILDRITLWIEGFLGNIWRAIKKIVKV